MTAPAPLARFSIDPAAGRLRVQAFVKGLLSFMGHDPVFGVGGFAGEAELNPDFTRGRIAVSAHAESLQVIGNEIEPDDRRQIEERARNDVLEAYRFPEIRFDGDIAGQLVGEERFALDLQGRLSLHGAVRPLAVPAQGHSELGGLFIAGGFRIAQSDFGIRPVTALAGALRIRDEVQVTFEFLLKPAEREESG